MTDRHKLELRGGINLGISDHWTNKVDPGAWGGVLRWNMKQKRLK